MILKVIFEMLMAWVRYLIFLFVLYTHIHNYSQKCVEIIKRRGHECQLRVIFQPHDLNNNKKGEKLELFLYFW